MNSDVFALFVVTLVGDVFALLLKDLVCVAVEIMTSNMSSKSKQTLRRHDRAKVQESVKAANKRQGIEVHTAEDETSIAANDTARYY